MTIVKELDAILPQTQCGECGYPGCLPYAQALAQGNTPINLCPPGGVETLRNIAGLLNQDPSPYLKTTKQNTRKPALAVIDEAECIGCTKCIQACPVDAVIGASKTMHSIINHECTGCGLCIEPCPVDCIELVDLPKPTYEKNVARKRFEQRTLRELQKAQKKERVYHEKRALASKNKQEEKNAKQAYIQQALARAKAKKNHE